MSKEDDEFDGEAWERKKELLRITSPEFRIAELIEKLGERVDVNDQESRRRDEENQRNIDFILRQQAQFTADMQLMREAQVHADEKWEQRWGRTEESIRALLSIAEIHDGEIKTLAETQAESQARTDRQMAETDERLNALVNVVERLISERRNGGAGAS
jgi:hypothetical protein